MRLVGQPRAAPQVARPGGLCARRNNRRSPRQTHAARMGHLAGIKLEIHYGPFVGYQIRNVQCICRTWHNLCGQIVIAQTKYVHLYL